MILQNKRLLFLIFVSFFLVVTVILFVVSIFVQQGKQPNTGPRGQFRLTQLEKTDIGKTTQREIEESGQVVSKTVRGETTIYQVTSITPFATDEIRTKGGKVVFEKTSTRTTKLGALPKLTSIQQKFGEPDTILKSVGPFGSHVSAYVYATKGLALFANDTTKSIYEVQRFTPMSTQDYEKEYAEFLKPAPTEGLERPF